MDILLIQSQKNGLTTSLFIEDFSIINHWSNHPYIRSLLSYGFLSAISLTLPQGFWSKNLQIFDNAWQHGGTK
jgi:hypothetical protein